MLILKTLTLEPLQAYGISVRIEQRARAFPPPQCGLIIFLPFNDLEWSGLRVSLNLLAIIAPSLQRLVRPIFSKQVAKAHGLSTSTIPKGPLQEGRQTELRGRSLEFFQMGYKYNRISEC